MPLAYPYLCESSFLHQIFHCSSYFLEHSASFNATIYKWQWIWRSCWQFQIKCLLVQCTIPFCCTNVVLFQTCFRVILLRSYKLRSSQSQDINMSIEEGSPFNSIIIARSDGTALLHIAVVFCSKTIWSMQSTRNRNKKVYCIPRCESICYVPSKDIIWLFSVNEFILYTFLYQISTNKNYPNALVWTSPCTPFFENRMTGWHAWPIKIRYKMSFYSKKLSKSRNYRTH